MYSIVSLKKKKWNKNNFVTYQWNPNWNAEICTEE